MGMWVPARTPDAIVSRLNQEILQALNRPEVKERLFTSGIEVVGGTPEQFARRISYEMDKWGKLIREAGLRE
jgi:tripartite-type tricarboxylate transporter receptor subunit TctC